MKFTYNLDDDLCKEKVATSNSDGEKKTMKQYYTTKDFARDIIIGMVGAMVFLTLLTWYILC